MENKKRTILKKARPFIGILFFLSLILICTFIVFFSVASIFAYPLLWVLFITLNFIKPNKRGFKYCLNAVRLAMWVYFVTIFLLLLWTPKWLQKWSAYLESKTWWNVFKEGSFMCGRTSFAFLLSLFVLAIFLLHYKWKRRRENAQQLTEENDIFLTKSL